MRQILRIFSVGLVWAVLDASILVGLWVASGFWALGASSLILSPIVLLLTSYSLGPFPSLPVWLFFILTAFGSGFALSDAEETIKALALATFLGALSGLLIVDLFAIPFPGTSQRGYAEASFFGILALPLFLVGLIGGLLGNATGAWAKAFLTRKPW